MAMSEAERKRRRAEASRKCYLKRKAAMAAQNKAGAKPAKKAAKAVKPAKKVEVRKAKKAGAKPTAAEVNAAKQAKTAEKLLAKLVSKGQKPASTAKALVKEAAQVVTEVFKTGNQTLIEKAQAQLERKLGLVVGDGSVTLSLSKAFKAPKAKAKAKAVAPDAAPAAKPAVEKSKEELEVLDVMAHSRDGLDTVEHTELSVDPAVAAALRDGADPKDVGVPDPDEDERDLNDPDADPEDEDREPDDEDDDDDDDEEKDPDEEAAEAAEADIEGRRDTLEELEAQGVGEDD